MLKTLKKTTEYTFSAPNPDMLETFPCPPFVKQVNLTQLEFTSICPVTGQPDYGKVEIRYSPYSLCIESKSLKLYLMAFRLHGAFCEQLSHKITKDLMGVLEARWVEVRVHFNSRGGITIESIAAERSLPR